MNIARTAKRLLALGALAAASIGAQAQVTEYITNGSFEAGTTGWSKGGVANVFPELVSGVGNTFVRFDDNNDVLIQRVGAFSAESFMTLSFESLTTPVTSGPARNILNYAIQWLDNSNSWTTVASGLMNNYNVFGPVNFTTTLLTEGEYRVRFAGVGNNIGRIASIDNISFTAAPVPEPETYAMMLAGLGAIGFMARRRKSREA